MRFADVRGHADVLARLRRDLESRPASAYLLVGPPGIGKRRVADALAARLLCEAVTNGDACGACRHCVRVAHGTHPDLLIVVRDEDRRDVRVDQIRELIRWFVLRPLMAARKVALVDGADEITEAGQNAILKTLEEPRGSATIILIADGPAGLLPTVRSRCRRLRLDPLPVPVVAEILEAAGHAPDLAARLAARSGGSVSRAIALADPEREVVRARMLALLADLAPATAADLCALAADLARGDTEAGLEAAVSWYRDLVHVSVGGPDVPIANTDTAGALTSAAAAIDPETALRLLEVVCDTVQAIGRNANKTLAIETMLLEARRLARRAGQAPWTSRAR